MEIQVEVFMRTKCPIRAQHFTYLNDFHTIRCEYIHLITGQNMIYNLQVRNLIEPAFSRNLSSKSLCNEVGYSF